MNLSRSSDATASWESSDATSTTNRVCGWRTLGSQHADPFSAPCRRIRFEVAGIKTRIEVGIGEFGADSKPAWSDGRVAAEQMQTSTTQTEVLDNVENFLRFLHIAEFVFLGDDYIDVEVGVNKVAISGSSNSSFDAHQAVF